MNLSFLKTIMTDWKRPLALGLLALGVLFVWSEAPAQPRKHVPSDHRGDPNFRRKSNIDGNNVRATVFNFGFSGRTAAVPDEIPLRVAEKHRPQLHRAGGYLAGGRGGG
ncbi:MAG: hypothetical protein Q9P14_06440 [candidate division KSB1 bacterium]|nr:hypothetical protein [candidate division KSB1 bacterium]